MGKGSGARRDELRGMGCTPSLPGPQPAPRADQILRAKPSAEIQAAQEKRNAALHKIDHSHMPPLRIADRYAAGRPRLTVRPRDGPVTLARP